MNIYDIAQKAGVSIATVSRVINGNQSVSKKTREKVTKVMNELGYSPNVFARGLMVNSMKTIGVMTVDVRDLYYARAIQTIESIMRLRGYDVILCSTSTDIEEKRKYLKLLMQKSVDGIILVGSIFKEKDDNSHIIETSEKVPIVIINGDVPAKNIYTILNDDCEGVYTAVNHLAALGHKNMVYLYDVDTFSGIEKINGFKKGMQHNNLSISKNSIIKVTKNIDGGYMATKNLLEQKQPFSAIVTSEDILAVGAMKALREAGISIPNDCAVVGYGNSIISECTTPTLTSIDNKVEATSSQAANILADTLEEKNVPNKTIIVPELVIRETT